MMPTITGSCGWIGCAWESKNGAIFNAIDLIAFSPLFFKEGLGVILRNPNKIPLYPPLQRGS